MIKKDHLFGRHIFDLCCYFFGRFKNRREIFCKAIKR